MKSIPAEIRRWLYLAVIILVVIATVSFYQTREAAKRAGQEARVGQAGSVVAKDAITANDARHKAADATDAVTKDNSDFIQGADNAKDDAGEAGRRGWIAHCRREQQRMRPLSDRCAGLLGLHQ